MTHEEFYKDYYPNMLAAEKLLLDLASRYPIGELNQTGVNPIAHTSSRIKSPKSVMQKLHSRGFEGTLENAMTRINDTVGLRIICHFLDDVYYIAAWLETCPEIRVLKVKDYIANPKPNGYRSLHLQVEIKTGDGAGLHAEIQLRTMAIDTWTTLEHQLKYKQKIPNEDRIQKELKRCADEIADVDVSMQSIRKLIFESMN